MTVRGIQQPSPNDDDPNYAPGWWYPLHGPVALGAGAVLVASTIVLLPFAIRRKVFVTQLGSRITTLAAGGNVQHAVYAARLLDNQPFGQPIIKTASFATDAAGLVTAPVLDVAGVARPTGIPLDRGLYWFATNADASAGGTVIMQAAAAANSGAGTIVGSATQSDISSAAAVAAIYRKISQTFGTWPDLTSAVFANGLDQAHCAGQMQVGASG